VISDVKIPVSTSTTVDYFDVYIVNVADFSPFNVELDGRTIKNDFYRYSVQGQEGHDEILGEGNYINYKYRGYDPRVGRLDWAVDPLSPYYPELTPYQFSSNRVIDGVELEGLEWSSTRTTDSFTGITTVTLRAKILVEVGQGVDFSEEQISSFKEAAISRFESTYSGQSKDGKTVFKSELEVVTVEEVELDDFEVMGTGTILTTIGGNAIANVQGGETRGQAKFLGGKGILENEVIVYSRTSEGISIDMQSLARTLAHELGHTAGLLHPWDPNQDVDDINQNRRPPLLEFPLDKDIKTNILNSEANPNPELKSNRGTKVTIGQLEKMTKEIESETKK
jgi:hypothetical protein